jgi:hypothetical protein
MRRRELVIPHVRSPEDEFTLVIRGRVGAGVGDAEYEMEPGDLAFKPRVVPHAMWNPSDEEATSPEFITPAGFEESFREVRACEAREVGPSIFVEIATRYGEAIKPEWIPELVTRYRVGL